MCVCVCVLGGGGGGGGGGGAHGLYSGGVCKYPNSIHLMLTCVWGTIKCKARMCMMMSAVGSIMTCHI